MPTDKVQKFKRSLLQKKSPAIWALVFIIAVAANIAILKLFNQKSSDRAAHSLVGIIMLMGFVSTFADDKTPRIKWVSFFFISLVPCYLGTVFPDLDIKLLGIGGHRNPLFHSGLSFFLLLVPAKRFRSFFIAAALASFGVGLGSHLIWDLFDQADVRWIPGLGFDRLWLGINGLFCILSAKLFLDSRL